MKPTRTKLYALFAQTRCGHVYGYVEHSFSMGWRADYVRVWDLKSATHYLNEFNKRKNLRVYRTEKNLGEFLLSKPSNDGAEEKAHDIVKFFLVRVNSAKSPVQIDMTKRRRANKFLWRNRPFTENSSKV
jgi:hypothetical protein